MLKQRMLYQHKDMLQKTLIIPAVTKHIIVSMKSLVIKKPAERVPHCSIVYSVLPKVLKTFLFKKVGRNK